MPKLSVNWNIRDSQSGSSNCIAFLLELYSLNVLHFSWQKEILCFL